MENESLSFGGYPIILERKDDEILIHCKNITGTLSQIEGFINEQSWKRHYFGQCKIRNWRNGEIKIDCLKDTKKNFINLYELIKVYKNGK